MKLVLNLLRKPGNVNTCFQVTLQRDRWWYSQEHWGSLSWNFQVGVRGVHLAACVGLVEACKILIEHGEWRRRPKDRHGQTPLWFAAAYGLPDLFRGLLNQGAFIETRDRRKENTLLYAAMRHGYKEVFEVLANAGADLEARTKYQGCPVGIAAELGNERMMKILLARGAKADIKIQNDITPLQRAATSGHETIFKMLVEAVGMDNVRSNRRGLLYDAAEGGNESIVRFILDDEDFPPDKKAKCAQHTLRAAILFRSENICRILLSVGGVSVEGKYADDRPLLSVAVNAWARSAALIKLLLDTYKANPNFKDNAGRSALSHAVYVNYQRFFDYDEVEDIIQLLLDADGVDFDSRDNDGRTPLHYAISSCLRMENRSDIQYVSDTVVRLLLDSGASVQVRDNDGETPLLYAAQLNLEELAKTLLERGADVDVKDNLGRTPLSYAVDPQLKEDESHDLKKLNDTITILLANGASLVAKDDDGLTPLSRAVARLPAGHETLVLLQEAASQLKTC
ncbi:ankyrin repeat-containing domain protein [Aspergillus multicolor]|uniref:ankyrin repeat domain-containing protein n=1 Tax=Aspergillus multicolor TaxID=41759 RepID=UPI003CCD8A2F